jgi:hypothetical protein
MGPRATLWTPSGPAARALARDHLTTPRQRGHREAIRVLHTTRSAIVAAGADARRQLKALIVTAPEPLRDALGGGPGGSKFVPVRRWSSHPPIRWSTGPPYGR